jgi:hypothetical protein
MKTNYSGGNGEIFRAGNLASSGSSSVSLSASTVGALKRKQNELPPSSSQARPFTFITREEFERNVKPSIPLNTKPLSLPDSIAYIVAKHRDSQAISRVLAPALESRAIDLAGVIASFPLDESYVSFKNDLITAITAYTHAK